MTIEEEPEPIVAPQATDTNLNNGGGGGDIESLVRALAEQVRAADDRAENLAERVALLSIANNTLANIDTATNVQRSSSNRVSFKETSARSIGQRGESKLQSVIGIPEDDDFDDNDEEQAALDDRITLLERRFENYADEKDIYDERKYALPESTFSLLVTHHPLSIPFCFAVFSVALSISCLCLTLVSSISNGTKGNVLGIPAGVSTTVRAAQFLGTFVCCGCAILCAPSCALTHHNEPTAPPY